MDFKSILDAVSTGGMPTLLLIILVGGSRGYWLFGASHRESLAAAHEQYEDMRADRDYWRQAALAGTDMAQRAVTIAERKARP